MKKIAVFVLTLLCAYHSNAQVDSMRMQLDTLFGSLDKTRVPSGYLGAYGTDMADKDDYNGIISDSNTINQMDMLRMLYADIYTAKFNPAAISMINLDSVNAKIDNSPANSLVILNAQYSDLRSDALDQGLLTYSNGRLYDGGTSRSERNFIQRSPYILKNVFCGYPNNSFFTDTVTLHYDPTLYFTNTTATITDVAVDFGSGYQSFSFSGNASYTYTDSSGLHIIKLKVSLSNGSIFYTQMVVEVKVTSSLSARYSLANLATPDIDIPALNGVHSGCRVYIRRSTHTPAGQLLKPFIVVEGFDFHDAAPTLSKNYDINDFIQEVRNTNTEVYNNPFDYQLDDVGSYDLVFVDWKNGTDDIQRNSALLEDVIGRINTMKGLSGSTQQNVVMGVSMGGLVARYTLASMTKRSVPTQTRLLLTMDSPHQGAYLPLAFQHLVRGLQNVSVLFVRLGSIYHNSLDQTNTVLSSAGAQQLLKMTVTDANGTVAANTFLNNIYRPMITFSPSDPQPAYVFKAVSDGSQCGIGSLAPGANLISGSASANLTALGIALDVLIGLPVITKLKFSTSIQANALTGVTAHQILNYQLKKNVKLFFVISLTKTYANLVRNEPSFNTIPWESVPAGNEPLGDALGIGSTPIEGNWSLLGPWFFGYNYNFTLAPSFGFVPVVSALDIQSPSSYYNQYIFPFNGTNGSTASTYIAQEKIYSTGQYNNRHTNFTSRNSRWIYNEMQNITQPAPDCDDACDNNNSVIGPDAFCTTATYTVTGTTAASTVTWTVAPSGIVSYTISGNTITLTRIQDGVISIIADVNGCFGEFTVRKDNIGVGKPVRIASNYTINGYSSGITSLNDDSYDYVCYGPVVHVNVAFENANSLVWNTTSSPTSVHWSTISTTEKDFYFYDINQYASFAITATNTCGSTLTTGNFASKTCEPGDPGACDGYAMSPNPANSGTLRVGPITNIPAPCAGRTINQDGTTRISKFTIEEVRVYDNSGTLRKFVKAHGAKEAFVDIRGLTPGSYQVQISDGVYKETQTLIVK